MEKNIRIKALLPLIILAYFWHGRLGINVEAKLSFNPTNTADVCGDSAWRIVSYIDVTLNTCMTECGRRTSCQAINFWQYHSHFCELLETTNVTSENANRCMFLRRQDIDLTGRLANACGCRNGESCDLDTGTCSKTECAAIRTVTSGKIYGNRYDIGLSLLSKCNSGFEPRTSKLTCLQTGEWDRRPACIQLCMEPDPLTFGAISGTNYSQGSTLDITCDVNYREVQGKTNMTCTPEALWDVTPICVLKECSAPSTLDNGQITGTVYTIGATLSITCNANYAEVNSITLMECKTNQQWNYTPTCVALECSAPSPLADGQITGSVYTIGATLSISCNEYYAEVSGATLMECKTNQQWNYTPTCVALECSAPSPLADGQITGSVYTIGTTLSISCNEYYAEVSGITLMECKTDQQWNYTPTCEALECSAPPSLSNGQITGSVYTIGATLIVSCNANYTEVSGITSMECKTNQQWNYTPTCVALECSAPPSLSNGQITGSVYTIGATLNVSCNANYTEVSGITSMECKTNQQWNYTPNCVASECSAPPSLSNGQITGSVYTVGATLSVSCNLGYAEANGITSMECKANQQWNYTPNCVASECSAPPSLSNGQITGSVYTVGATLGVSCNLGYAEENSLTYIECEVNLLWNHTPACVLVDCGQPNAPNNGYLVGSQYKYDSTIDVFCNVGYALDSIINSIITCQSNGDWSSEPASCVLQTTTAITTTPAPPSCGNDWIVVESTCFYISKQGSESAKIFDDAKTFCNGLSANLARLDTSGKYEAVRTALSALGHTAVNNYHIGLKRNSNSGQMLWLDNGLPYSFNNFANYQPEDNNEWCGFLWTSDGWQWHDGMCNWNSGFVCSKDV